MSKIILKFTKGSRTGMTRVLDLSNSIDKSLASDWLASGNCEVVQGNASAIEEQVKKYKAVYESNVKNNSINRVNTGCSSC